ncbi:HTH-type transcriptional repressor GlcR [Lactococcus lactis]|nr:HTH-type transcriptional repressor GlcR [Lactococcus lactis]
MQYYFQSMRRQTVQLLPGKLNKNQLFLYGAETVEKLSQYQVDFTILVFLLFSNDGLFIHTPRGMAIGQKKNEFKQGKQVHSTTDHTKLNKEGFFKICDLKEIDYLITGMKN